MMVQASEDMCEDSAVPTDSHSTPNITQPSTSKPQKRSQDGNKGRDSGPTEAFCPRLQEKFDLEENQDCSSTGDASLKKREDVIQTGRGQIETLMVNAHALVVRLQGMTDDNRFEPERPLKKKDQVALDEEMARNLEAQMQAEL
ncbi:hypothetical protein Tco_0604263 [Tanacetum coccineum]